MSGNEEYLDSLLENISEAKENSIKADEDEMSMLNEKTRRRQEVSADDDFLKAKGLSDAPLESADHEISIDDLLKNARFKMDGDEDSEDDMEGDSDTPSLEDIPLSPDDSLSDEAAEKKAAELDDISSLLHDDGSGDLGEISDMLNADESGTDMSESVDEYNKKADAAEHSIDEEDAASEVDETEPDSKQKKGIFEKLKNVFSGGRKKKGKSDETKDVSSEVVIQPDEEKKKEDLKSLDEENQAVLSAMEKEDSDNDDGTELIAKFFSKKKADRKAKKEQAKKDKPPKPEKKKEKKEKPKKEKPKKEKKPDTSPFIPKKIIVVHLFLALSLTALIVFGVFIMAPGIISNNAAAYENKDDYIGAYSVLAGNGIKDSESRKTKAALLADMDMRYKSYKTLFASKKYDMALNELLIGVSHHSDNAGLAKDAGCGEKYEKEYSLILSALQDKYGISEDSAKEMLSAGSKADYTEKIQKAVKAVDIDASAF